MSNKIGFILIKPQLGQNIGATARIIKNFGFSNLILTQPKEGWPNSKAKATSVGAIDVLNQAKVYKNTELAIKKFNLIFSFSARKRDINKKHISLEFFKKIVKRNRNLNIGLMFGPEASGLSNLDLSYSNYLVKIPTSSKFKSLNLSHSISIISYEVFKLLGKKKFKKEPVKSKKAKKKDLIAFLNLLKKLLEKRNFFKPIEKKNSMITNINNLFYRFEPNDKEIRILASIISSLSKKNHKA